MEISYLVGGVAEWLWRWSLTGRLSLICVRSMVVRWPLCGSTVCYGSANLANSAFHPPSLWHGLQGWRPLYHRLELRTAAWRQCRKSMYAGMGCGRGSMLAPVCDAEHRCSL